MGLKNSPVVPKGPLAGTKGSTEPPPSENQEHEQPITSPTPPAQGGGASETYATSTASMKAHCSCPTERNLVVCIDGTGNQFSEMNSNVVELYSHLVKDKIQLTYYNSGIGTYVHKSEGLQSQFSPSSLLQWLVHAVDMVVARTFTAKVLSAYQWLSENYMDGDRIFLFGFSRGAYQVRVIAGMLELVGLLHKGNLEQIPFAYELYRKSIANDKRSSRPNKKSLYIHFKKTFSHPNVKAHFVGTWDTVSSVGLFTERRLPETITGMKHVCAFRQALALDDRRVKFLPEYANGGASPSGDHIKEVWFAGTHSDIGGGNVPNEQTNRFGPSLRWMSYEAISWGLRMSHHQGAIRPVPLKDSMNWFWWIVELFPIPISRLSYRGQDDVERWPPHCGRPRKILPGQLIHQSVIQEMYLERTKKYIPRPQPLGVVSWDKLTPTDEGVEKDPYTQSEHLLSNILQALKDSGMPSDADINALRTMLSHEIGHLSITSNPTSLGTLVKSVEALCQIRDDKWQPLANSTFEVLMEALLIYKESLAVEDVENFLQHIHADLIATHAPSQLPKNRLELVENTISNIRLPRYSALIIGIDTFFSKTIASSNSALTAADDVNHRLSHDLKIPSQRLINLRNESADYKSIIQALSQLMMKANKKGDMILVYYAGRSTPDRSILPYDWNPESCPEITEHDITRHILPFANAQNITVIMDCGFVEPASARRGVGRAAEGIHDVFTIGHDSKPLHIPTIHTLTAYETRRSHSFTTELQQKIDVGIFTTELLAGLREIPGFKAITYDEILHRMKPIPGYIFESYGWYGNDCQCMSVDGFGYRPRSFASLTSTALPEGRLSRDDESDKMKSNEDEGNLVAATSVTANDAQLNAKVSTIRLLRHQAPALLTKPNEQFQLYVDMVDKHFNSRIQGLVGYLRNTRITDNHDEAHIGLAVDKEKNQLRFDVLDKVLSRKNVTLKPQFAPNDDQDLLHVLQGLAHYYWYLKRTTDTPLSLDDISISFVRVKDAALSEEAPRFIALNGSNKLCDVASCIDIEVDDSDIEDDSIYGFELVNMKGNKENLFPVLLYFDNTDFTISSAFRQAAGPNPEAPWSGSCMTIGYGFGAGAAVPPFSFTMAEGYDVEAGFFKLFLSNKPIDLDNVVQEISPFTSSRGFKLVRPDCPLLHKWADMTFTVITHGKQ